MRKLIFTSVLIFIILTPLVHAKTIVYITNSSTDTPCSSLSLEESFYCNRLSDLDHDIRVINEQHVKENTTAWNSYVDSSDMIFLGEVSLDMVNTSLSQDIFCGNISTKLNENRTLFATFSNTWKNVSDNIEGCAFHPSINLVSWNLDDNRCSKKTLKVLKEGFITESYSLDDNVDFYSEFYTVKIHNVSDGGWFSGECTPIGGSIGFYPVINTSSKGVFWGLDNPSNFTTEAWDVFDRTILEVFNETLWSIELIIIPKVATVNQDIWVLANVTQFGEPVTDGTVNFTADGVSGILTYEDELWVNKAVKLPETKTYLLNMAAYSDPNLRGTAAETISVGDLTVDITSGDFSPGIEYTIYTDVYLGTDPQPASVSFRILDLTYSTLLSGDLTCSDNECSSLIGSMPNANSLILEVTASNQSIGKTGGNFKVINRLSITTDKEQYRPGDTINIDFFPPENMSEANLTIIKPDGELETPSPIPMNQISSIHWSKNYTLGTAAPNGTYTISIKALKENETIESNKTINVLAWKAFVYLNKYSFNIFEILDLSVETTDVYSSDLSFTANVEIINPNGVKVFTTTGSIEGSDIYKTTYTIPEDYVNGISDINIFLTDSDKRNTSLGLNFTFNFTIVPPSLFVTPNIISEVTTEGKILRRDITIENSADINVTNLIINISSGLRNIVNIISKPVSILPKSSDTLKTQINTRGLSPSKYIGTIDIFSQVGSEQVAVSIEVVGNLSSEADQKLEELYLLDANITYLKDRGIDVSEAITLFNETETLLNEVKTDFENEEYKSAQSKLSEATSKITGLITKIGELYASIPDYTPIIWNSAIVIIIIIIVITLFKYRSKIKRLFKGEKKKEKREEIYYWPRGRRYRTEYY